MKRLIFFSFIVCIAACKKDTAQPSQTTKLTTLLNSGGSWTIANLVKEWDIEPGKNLTGSTLVFQSDGKMQVHDNTAASSGVWSVYSRNEETIFSITIDDEYFVYLSSPWRVKMMTNERLDLELGGQFRSFMTLVNL